MSEDNHTCIYHIVVADDEKGMRNLIERICRNTTRALNQNAEIRTFPDGEDALAYIKSLETPPHLMITDWHMERMHGDELIANARQRFPSLPVIFSSAEIEALPLAKRLNADWLGKPWLPNELSDKLIQYAPKA